MNDDLSNIPTLTKHQYPLWIKIFSVITVFAFIITITHFMLFEFKQRITFYKKVQAAQEIFETKDYKKAIEAYTELLNLYPKYTASKIQLAKAHFALSNDDEYFFIKAFDYLKGSYEVSTLENIRNYIPEEYKNIFNGVFQIT